MAKLIITSAVTGSVHVPSLSPYLPLTPDQIADDAIRSVKAGAAIVHVHARDRKTGRPSSDPTIFEEIVTKITANEARVTLGLKGLANVGWKGSAEASLPSS